MYCICKVLFNGETPDIVFFYHKEHIPLKTYTGQEKSLMLRLGDYSGFANPWKKKLRDILRDK